MATLTVAPVPSHVPAVSQGIGVGGGGSGGGGGLVPSTSTSKHYSTRQRNGETPVLTLQTDTGRLVNKLSDEGSEGKEKQQQQQQQHEGNKNACTTTPSTAITSAVTQTSPTTNMPTKRFSFLMRSTSMKHDTTTTTTTTPQEPVTPSDQAILDKLATLTLPDPDIIVKPRVKCTLFNPACVRCGDPVYPQERIEPTLRLVYHHSCFKCYHCGLRLTLKTFCRSPLSNKDARVYCRSHVPGLDPGRVSAGDDENGFTQANPHTLPRDNSSSNRNSSTAAALLRDQLDIVKCDTIGLRYL